MMKKVLFVLGILALEFLFLSCVTPLTNHPVFEPINSEYVTVRMTEGNLGAEIRNSDFFLAVFPRKLSLNGSFGISIVLYNYTSVYMPIRYTDFKLYYKNNKGDNIFERCLTVNEWVNYGNVNSYRRETLKNLSDDYFRENDILPNRNYSAGLIAFEYDNFETFELSVSIFGKEYFIKFQSTTP
jgi:hypothetical protein